MTGRLEKRWELQGNALRDPLEVLTCSPGLAGITRETLVHDADKAFVELLARLRATVFVTREYENLVLAIHARDGKIEQTFLPVPHPSGLVADRDASCLYVASTRNPNQVVELRAASALIRRQEGGADRPRPVMMIARKKYYPGCYYFHDMAMVGGRLHAVSVGMNGTIPVNLDSPFPEKLDWFPKCTEAGDGTPITTANYIQLNSIAAGVDLRRSFFSASGDRIGSRRPGHLNYPVDGRGVIFSGASREVIALGLTRPHSARLHKRRIWVDNSGYGEFGFIEDGAFHALARLPGWTRGLCIIGEIALVGVSRVLSRYRAYAPGVSDMNQRCGVYAVSLNDGAVIGGITWAAGNQVFGIDYMSTDATEGFMQKTLDADFRPMSETCYNSIW